MDLQQTPAMERDGAASSSTVNTHMREAFRDVIVGSVRAF